MPHAGPRIVVPRAEVVELGVFVELFACEEVGGALTVGVLFDPCSAERNEDESTIYPNAQPFFAVENPKSKNSPLYLATKAYSKHKCPAFRQNL